MIKCTTSILNENVQKVFQFYKVEWVFYVWMFFTTEIQTVSVKVRKGETCIIELEYSK